MVVGGEVGRLRVERKSIIKAEVSSAKIGMDRFVFLSRPQLVSVVDINRRVSDDGGGFLVIRVGGGAEMQPFVFGCCCNSIRTINQNYPHLTT